MSDIDTIRERHHPVTIDTDGSLGCAGCVMDWPCDTRVALDANERLQQTIEYLDRTVAAAADMQVRSTGLAQEWAETERALADELAEALKAIQRAWLTFDEDFDRFAVAMDSGYEAIDKHKEARGE